MHDAIGDCGILISGAGTEELLCMLINQTNDRRIVGIKTWELELLVNHFPENNQ